MTKVAYNNCYGGFKLSDEVVNYIINHSSYTEEDCDFGSVLRHDPILIEALEKYPDKEISIAEIEGDRYWIWEYDGVEHVYTPKTIPWIYINS